jgi:hypothetical protein
MKLQIIETEQYILAVSDEEIKEGDWYFDSTDKAAIRPIYKRNQDLIEEYFGCKKIIAYQPKGNATELDLPLLPEIDVEDDVEKLADKATKKQLIRIFGGESKEEILDDIQKRKHYFKLGYKSATRKYSEYDLRKAFEAGMYFIGEDKGSYEEFIQSLKQSKTPKWFVAETKTVWRRNTDRSVPTKADLDEELKTTTINGKTYLVGHYE